MGRVNEGMKRGERIGTEMQDATVETNIKKVNISRKRLRMKKRQPLSGPDG